jgi:arylsulfatase A-like enzyme
MTMKVIADRFLKILSIGIPMLFLLTRCTEEINKPNIIFFIADDMYPEMFNCLPEGVGKNLTPNLDRLANEGVIMINQTVVSPVCTPSRYNCLTGNYASRATNKLFLEKTKKEENQTVIQWNTFITQKDKILSHYLKALGYTTGFVGKNHVIEVEGLYNYKFDDFYADPNESAIKKKLLKNYRQLQDAVINCGFDFADALYHNNPRWLGLETLAVQNMDWIADAGIRFIERYHAEPFFLYFATTLPHAPTDPEHSWRADPKVTAKGILDEALNMPFMARNLAFLIRINYIISKPIPMNCITWLTIRYTGINSWN